MKQLIFGLCAFITIVAASCTKDKTDKPDPVQENVSIKGDWAVSSIVTKEDGFDPVTYQGKADDYYKFGDDGNVAVKVDEFETTVTYQMVDQTHVNIAGDVEEIKELSLHKMILHSPATADAPEDETITLTR